MYQGIETLPQGATSTIRYGKALDVVRAAAKVSVQAPSGLYARVSKRAALRALRLEYRCGKRAIRMIGDGVGGVVLL